MIIRRVFSVPERSMFADLAFLLMRVVAGMAFMHHGWSKIQHPFEWMGEDGFAPGILQAAAAVSEFGGGLAWILGLLTPLASLGIASTMAVAFSLHTFKLGDPFVAEPGGRGSELATVYFSIALLLMAAGPGRLSLDRLIFGPRRRGSAAAGAPGMP